MAHESDMTRRFADLWKGHAADVQVAARWTKLQESNKRGVPDAHLWVSRHAGAWKHTNPATCAYGPAAWCEVKRKAWPSKIQAMRLAAIAVRGEPAYVLRLVTKDFAELYAVRVDAAATLHEHGDRHRDMYEFLIDGDWSSVARAFILTMATDRRPLPLIPNEDE